MKMHLSTTLVPLAVAIAQAGPALAAAQYDEPPTGYFPLAGFWLLCCCCAGILLLGTVVVVAAVVILVREQKDRHPADTGEFEPPPPVPEDPMADSGRPYAP